MSRQIQYINKTKYFISIILVGMLFINACSVSSVRKYANELSDIEAHITPPDDVFTIKDKIYIKFINEDKFVYLTAVIPESPSSAMEKFSIVTLSPEKPAKKVLRDEHAKVIYINEGLEALIKQVVMRQVPEKKNTGVVLMIHDFEAVLYKDSQGKPQIVPLEKIPADIKITGGVDAREFNALVLKEFKKELESANIGQTKFLFTIKNVPLQPYLYIDTSRDITITLQLPEYYKMKSEMTELGFSISFIYSFFIKSHLFAAIKSPFTTTHRLFSLTKNSIYSGMAPLLVTMPEIPPLNTSGEMMDLNSFEEYLNKIISKQTYKADVGLLIDGDEFFSHFIIAASRAKHSIFIRLYIFAADAYGLKIADLLKKKSLEKKEGSNSKIEVRVLVDELNTLLNFKKAPGIAVSKDFVMQSISQYLKKDSKVAVRTRLNTWATFDHSKVIIIDRELAYTGGMNFGEDYRYLWHDMMISLQGPVVGKLVKNFYETWSFAGLGGDFAAAYRMLFSKSLRNVNLEKPGMIDVRLLYTSPAEAQIFKAQLEAIKRAKSRIYIENAYFSDDRIVNALVDARGRGVDVRVILPGENDVSIMHKNNLYKANYLFNNGIKVYFYKGMTHVKAAIYDNWAVVGSANFDKMSLYINNEMSVAISDEKFVKELEERLFEVDFKNSDLMEEEIQLDFNYHIVGAIISQL